MKSRLTLALLGRLLKIEKVSPVPPEKLTFSNPPLARSLRGTVLLALIIHSALSVLRAIR